jgi:lysophospholipase L1-like esterase
MLLQPNDHILFYGDSITDAGRNQQVNNNGGLGVGYPALCAAQLLALYPEFNLTVTNRGISGNRIYDLEERLEKDVVALQPTVVSILIGINDTWRRYDSGRPSPIPEFQASYRRILLSLRDRLGARFVLLEPFLLPIPADRKAWREDLDPRITAVRELAREFDTLLLPLDGIFAAASCRASMEYWAGDGVHPSLAGHGLIAEHWVDLVTA